MEWDFTIVFTSSNMNGSDTITGQVAASNALAAMDAIKDLMWSMPQVNQWDIFTINFIGRD